MEMANYGNAVGMLWEKYGIHATNPSLMRKAPHLQEKRRILGPQHPKEE